MDNLKEMDKFLEEHNLLRPNQEKIENINRPITSTEIGTVIKNLPTNQNPGPNGFTGKFYQTSREKITPILLNLFQNIAEGGTLSKLILRGHHHPDAKARQRCHKERKLKANITDEHRCKNLQQNSTKQNPTTH